MAGASPPTQNTPQKNQNKKFKWSWFVGISLVGMVLVFTYWWFFVRNRVSTEDAYVKADSAMVSSRVPGTIIKLLIDNDDFVEEGTVLIQLDPEDFQAEVNKKQAALERTEADIKVMETTIELTESRTKAQVEIAEAALKAAQNREIEARHRLDEVKKNRGGVAAEFNQTKTDLARYSNLLKSGAGSQQQQDKSSTAFKKAKAQLEAADAQIAATQAELAVILQDIDRARAQLDSAQADRLQIQVERNKLASLKAKLVEMEADLQLARLNLSYTIIKAPIAGYVAQKRVQVGDRVQPGAALLAVVPLHDVYVEANFKETQLADVRLGQPVEIRADIYPDHVYHGRVVGIRAGTGAAFSLLPPENATGNWIKVVQRVPVKIKLDDPYSTEYPLRVGLSLDVSISTKNKSGPRLLAEQMMTQSAGLTSGESTQHPAHQ